MILVIFVGHGSPISNVIPVHRKPERLCEPQAMQSSASAGLLDRFVALLLVMTAHLCAPTRKSLHGHDHYRASARQAEGGRCTAMTLPAGWSKARGATARMLAPPSRSTR